MKLLFCVTLTLIIFFNVSSCTNDVAKIFEKPNEDDDKMKITDLDEDCAFIILERLNFSDLLNVAQINDKFSMVAADVYRRKYSHLYIAVVDEFLLPNKPNELLDVAGMEIDTDTIDQVNGFLSYDVRHSDKDINEEETYISIGNCDALLNLFKHFGHFIKRISSRTDSRERPVQSELIGKLISKYSSESLVDIQFQNNAEKLLEHITKPLINVEGVIFAENKMNFCPQDIRINEIFPALRHLDLWSLTDRDLAYLDRHFPHLEHVYIVRTNKSLLFPFPNVILKNPQIKSIFLRETVPEFVQKMNRYLPQLEHLTLMECQLGRESIRFENVTTLVIDHREHGSLANLHFPRLRNLEVYEISNRVEYSNFLSEHYHLSEFHLYLNSWMTAEELQLLTADLKNLVILTLDNKYELNRLSSNDIVEFLRTHANVKQLNVINFTKQLEDELQQQLQRDWNTQIADVGLSFKRKANNQL